MIFEIISGTTLSVVLAILFANNRKLKKEMDQLTVLLVEEHFKMQKQQQELDEMSKLAPIDTTDGFVKFLSQSREWAFDYIDNVQVQLEEFDKEISTLLNKTTLDVEEINKIAMAYQTLKQNVLPENKEMPNN